MKAAAHYGCHALRPYGVTHFDNPMAPTIFERLLAPTGVTVVDWPMRLECCGNPLAGKNDMLSKKLTHKKQQNASQAGANVLVTACTYCQIQFDTDNLCNSPEEQTPSIPRALLYPQLLGLALGLAPKDLGIDPVWGD